jgi:hypothetical protein
MTPGKEVHRCRRRTGLASGLAPAMKAKKTELLGLGCGSAGPRLRLGAVKRVGPSLRPLTVRE